MDNGLSRIRRKRDASTRRVSTIPTSVAVLLLVIGWTATGCAGHSAFAADNGDVCPSRVLVLYNADRGERLPGNFALLGGEQESRAVALEYVRMRGDPVTGERPALLGLHCGGGAESPLNQDHLAELSRDNHCGVVYQGPEDDQPLSGCDMRDSRLVEVVLPDSESAWDQDSLYLELIPDVSVGTTPIVLVEGGLSRFPGAVQVQQGEDWQIRANGRTFLHGRFTAVARCRDMDGELHEWRAPFHDVQYAAFSRTGADGIRDDQNYLDCVENPVKAFLEDPENARPDGTLLRDHVLHIVVAHGLPKTAVARYGIAPGITERLNNYGPDIDFGQRLQVMYYDLQGVHQNRVGAKRFTPARGETAAFGRYLFRTELAEPLWGVDMNPFVHPQAYLRESGKLDTRPPRFTAAQRAFRPDRHLYFSMRIDGHSALEAMDLIHRAVYASRFAGPEMGVLEGVPLNASPERTGDISRGPGKLFWDAGYRHLFRESWGRGRVRIALFRLAPDMGFLNTTPVFLPGGIATQVLSRSSWNREDSPLNEYLRQGVTVTAGAARSGGGAPHIHNHSFWDEEIFNPLLLEGYPVGELLLMSQIHLGWVTSFVGDPLYRLPARPSRPKRWGELAWEEHVRVMPSHDSDHGPGYLVMVDLGSTAEEPRVAQLRLTGNDGAVGGDDSFVQGRFSARPAVFVPAEAMHGRDGWRVELMDPFGEQYRLEGRLPEVHGLNPAHPAHQLSGAPQAGQ
ncbi:hypothetical protein [Desulfonatronum thioautotrophicum]|uniref:hypothetical protein n=1 Tax=Desulfonatronum thioautotrophicum TaxID=617001 RepID=UPI0005EB0472|nr:hypothetical protein [Desulfonatronum thioautotrophicum]